MVRSRGPDFRFNRRISHQTSNIFPTHFSISNIGSPPKLFISKKLLLKNMSHVFTATAAWLLYKLSLQLPIVKLLASKSGCVKFWTNIMSASNTPKLSSYQIFSSFSLSSASLVQIESFIADLIWSAPQSSSSHHHCRALICTFDSCTNCTIKSALKLSDKKEMKISIFSKRDALAKVIINSKIALQCFNLQFWGATLQT